MALYEHYNQIEEQADLGFAPDSSTLTYAEKGLLQVKLHGQEVGMILQAGQASILFPDKATYACHRLEVCFPVLDQGEVQYSQAEDSVTVLGAQAL